MLILSVCIPGASVIWDLCTGSSTREQNDTSGDMDFQVLIFIGSKWTNDAGVPWFGTIMFFKLGVAIMAANHVTGYLHVGSPGNTIIFACFGLILVLILSVCMPSASVIWDLCVRSSTKGKNDSRSVIASHGKCRG
ncbi:hypothetical protein TSUD_260800 [Trifolium subterraneum]|uniref:Uncharacterized protein n=1 Tax=Trifolium subterraneum TaxID=3900 RepID=A0A2Z6MG72_TRISU|nr:hypothetical protein TSUD_260800 [Trifolium subterraneum]